MSRQVPTEDLLVLARQCRLSEEEERRFELAVQSSRELSCLYEAGVRFDDEAGLLSGDEAHFSRLVESTLARMDQAHGVSERRASSGALAVAARPSHALLIARYFAASLGCGLLLCVTLASAWDYVEKHAAQQTQQALREREPSASSAATRKPGSTPNPTPIGAPSAQPLAAPPLVEASSEQPHPAPAALAQTRKVAVDDKPSPRELFARASQARQKGDIEAAISLYERLGREYPSSVEAEDAKVLCGNLLLNQRSPRAALRQFESYHAGALSLEALWGRALALRKLESPDERTILLELVRDYPGSAYAEAAEKRLRELSR